MASTGISLTPREQNFCAVAFQCMSDKPQIDWNKFAAMTGLKNAKSARDSFAPLMKKLMSAEKGSESAEDPVTPTPKSKKERKRKADTKHNGDTTPVSKKPTARNKKALKKDSEDPEAKVKSEPVEDGEADAAANDTANNDAD